MKFFVTFGSQYSYQEHPLYDDAHPDGWVEIQAQDETIARMVAWMLFGDHWSFIYAESEFENRSYYPRGVLAQVEAQVVAE